MDLQYIDHLVHPKNKTPLRYLEASKQLVDTITNDKFDVKDNIPILLTSGIDKSLMETQQHSEAGSQFQYKEHYQKDAQHYDYFKEVENPIEKEEINRLHEHILSMIPSASEWVLDVGSGGGWLAKALMPRNKKVISMDISEINPVKATRNVPSDRHFGLVADVFELPVKEGSIDTIVASEIIEHVSDPKRFIEALYTALKPGGRIIITTPYNELIRYSLCIHCNQLTPQNAHLHSFTEESIKNFSPAKTKNLKTKVFNNKILVKLRLQYLLKFLPLPLWRLIDNFANMLSNKTSYRLMLVIEK